MIDKDTLVSTIKNKIIELDKDLIETKQGIAEVATNIATGDLNYRYGDLCMDMEDITNVFYFKYQMSMLKEVLYLIEYGIWWEDDFDENGICIGPKKNKALLEELHLHNG
jgi:hypothetical protein